MTLFSRAASLMDDATRGALGEINRVFYRVHARDFDQTRRRPSRGWERVAARIAAQRPSVLDVGCGNGRLGRYLVAALGRPIEYVGVDVSPELLALARTDLGSDARLVEHDFLAAPARAILPDAAGRDHALVAVFNVLHHVPGRDRRRELIEAAAERTASGGVLAFAIWQFGNRPRFAERFVPWTEASAPAVDLSQLEPGDHLLRWNDDAVRYCHSVDEREAEELADLDGFDVVDRYDTDGRSDDLNRYCVLMRR